MQAQKKTIQEAFWIKGTQVLVVGWMFNVKVEELDDSMFPSLDQLVIALPEGSDIM